MPDSSTLDVVQTVASIVGLISIGLLWLQMRQTTKWHKLQAQNTFLSDRNMEYQEKLQKEANRLDIDLKARSEQLSDDEVNSLWADQDAYNAMAKFLNDCESICMAILAGMVDKHLAFSSHASRLIHYYWVYRPFIGKVREHYDNDSIFLAWTKIYCKWKGPLDVRNRKARLEAKKFKEIEARLSSERMDIE